MLLQVKGVLNLLNQVYRVYFHLFLFRIQVNLDEHLVKKGEVGRIDDEDIVAQVIFVR